MKTPYYLQAERPAPLEPTLARVALARVFGLVLLALLATTLIKCTA